MPPPGRLHEPVWKPLTENRTSSTSPSTGSPRRTRAYAPTRCIRNGDQSASACWTIGTVGTVPSSTSPSGSQAESTVEPSTSTTRGSGASGGTHASYTIRSAW